MSEFHFEGAKYDAVIDENTITINDISAFIEDWKNLNAKAKEWDKIIQDLREKYPGLKRLPVRREDTVEVIKGQFIGIKKRVTKVRLDKMMIEIENVRSQKTDGTEIFHPISPSNCKIVALGKIDGGRRKIIERRTIGGD